MITYEAEGVKFPNIKKRETSNWIRKVAATYGKKVGEVGYMFVNDDKILEVNNEFLGHDYYTDIITFDYVAADLISGDIMISVDRVGENAKNFGVPFEQELYRVIIHGVLHLLGQGDKTDPEAAEMRRQEEEALSLWNTMFPVEQIG